MLRLRGAREGQAVRLLFLLELAASKVHQISIEAAEPKLDCAILAQLKDKRACSISATCRALAYVAPERLIVAPDCGLKYLPREVAFAKLEAMVAGAAIVRREFAG
ncbi:MAG TPA: hypothetical protein VH639_24225 [Bryobacteraceae bacterium]